MHARRSAVPGLPPFSPDSYTRRVWRACCSSLPAVERFYRRHLPHYEIGNPGTVYFVSWRLDTRQSSLTPDERDIVLAAIEHWDGTRCDLLAFVVMDDHVHVLLRLNGSVGLDRLLHSWKGFTGRQLAMEGRRLAPVWQQESYDHLVRTEEELEMVSRYIAENPQKRWPDCTSYRWLRVHPPRHA
jgi:REP element-mobilizing transposase RayT